MQARLEAANALLREEGDVKKRLLSAETNRTMFEQLDRDMERRIQTLGRLIEALPETPHPRDLTAYITPLLVPYQTQIAICFSWHVREMDCPERN